MSPIHRGEGLGRRLMARLLEQGRRAGCRVAWVLTDEENVAANRLYGAVGGRAGAGGVVMYEFELGGGLRPCLSPQPAREPIGLHGPALSEGEALAAPPPPCITP